VSKPGLETVSQAAPQQNEVKKRDPAAARTGSNRTRTVLARERRDPMMCTTPLGRTCAAIDPELVIHLGTAIDLGKSTTLGQLLILAQNGSPRGLAFSAKALICLCPPVDPAHVG
jgi:hypothetical protein